MGGGVFIDLRAMLDPVTPVVDLVTTAEVAAATGVDLAGVAAASAVTDTHTPR